MKRLLLFRHAKSSWNDPSIADFERPLNQRGLAVAPLMGELMAGRGILPDAIICSPARRAVQTATILKECGGMDAAIKLDERIYEASPQALLHVAAELDEKFSSIMMVGHNPGFEGFVALLTGTVEPMPTAALAVIQLDIDEWRELGRGVGRITEVIRPREALQKFADY